MWVSLEKEITEKEAGENVFAVAFMMGETRSSGNEGDTSETQAEEGTEDEYAVTLQKEERC